MYGSIGFFWGTKSWHTTEIPSLKQQKAINAYYGWNYPYYDAKYKYDFIICGGSGLLISGVFALGSVSPPYKEHANIQDSWDKAYRPWDETSVKLITRGAAVL